MVASRGRRAVLGLVCVLSIPVTSGAQDTGTPELPPETSRQLWVNFTLSFPRSERLYLEYDIEGARQVSGDDPWRYLYGTGLAEYYPNSFVDLTGELTTGFTRQSREENSFEATLRAGVRLHLITQIFNSPLVRRIRPERVSGKRFSVAALARIEWRNFQYTGDRPSTSDFRFRNRLEFKFALNSKTLAKDGVWYLMADGEWFVPMNSDQAAERFATKFRARAGLGYRRGYRWRFEALAMRDDARDTLAEEFDVEAVMIDLRVKRFF